MRYKNYPRTTPTIEATKRRRQKKKRDKKAKRFGTQTRPTAIYGVVNDPNQKPSQRPSKNQKS